MQTQPVSVRKSFIAVVILFLLVSFLLAGLLASALKKKREYEKQPVTPVKTYPPTSPARKSGVDYRVNLPDRRAMLDAKKDAANEALLNKHGLSLEGGHTVSKQ